ncbi:MAG: response regulator [Candidatus Adiutrix sp.]|nr:response regulator [Candidatus Adiutrix sp.]
MLFISIYISMMMNSTSAFLKSNIESRLIAISRLAAQEATPYELSQLVRPEDMEKPLYGELKRRLIAFGEEEDVLFVYYMRLTEEGQCQFIIDNDLTEDSVSLASEPIDIEPSPELAFSGQAATAGLGNYSVGYTGLLSSFAPVFDEEGRVTAIAGVDITDEQVIVMQDTVDKLAAMLTFSMVVVLSSGCLGFYLYRRKARQSNAANLSKSRFLANMSHEIRTPLNAIIGLSEIEMQKELPQETLIDIEKIRNSGVNLLGIINDILDISKIEAGAFEIILADFDVPMLINEVVQQNIVRIGAKNIKFVLKLDETFPNTLHGDALRIRQVLTNVLSNAFKYTKEGTVTLSMEWKRAAPFAECSFTVSDTGVGIKHEDLTRMFNDYTQLNSAADRNIEGTGLGLAITKNLLRLMGGNITVESEYGSGSRFTVNLPLKMVGDEPIGLRTAEELTNYSDSKMRRRRKSNFVRSKIPPGRVLIVDDLDVNLMVAKGLLKSYGLAVDTAASGAEAIEKIRSAAQGPVLERYDMVFMDHMMPGMDGVEATRIIRREIASDYARAVPIIALTANALAGSREMFLENGFNSFLPKPINVAQLDRELSAWIKEKHSTDDV